MQGALIASSTGAITLPSDARSASAARRWLTDLADAAGVCAPVREVATLLVSELITNVVVHARTDMTVRADLGGGVLRLEVTDSHTSGGEPAIVYRPPGQGGLGLQLVDQLARRWGVAHEDGCTTVWFDVDV